MLKCVSIKRWWDERFLGLLLRVPLWIVLLLVGKWILLVRYNFGLYFGVEVKIIRGPVTSPHPIK